MCSRARARVLQYIGGQIEKVAICTGYLHLVEGSEKKLYGKEPVLDDIGGLLEPIS